MAETIFYFIAMTLWIFCITPMLGNYFNILKIDGAESFEYGRYYCAFVNGFAVQLVCVMIGILLGIISLLFI